MFMVLLLPPLCMLLIWLKEMAPIVVIQKMLAGVSPFPFIAVPLFIFAAEIMVRGQLSARLINVALKLVGHLHGGLAQTLVVSCMFFGSLSGSTQATVAAVGGTLYPDLKKGGYKDTFVLGAIVNASDVAQLIPPSISMIVYGVLTGSSIGKLFLAGILPGIILGLSFMAYAYWWAKRHRVPRLPRATFGEIWVSVKESSWPLGLPVIIIGGIYSGVLTPTEAASAAVVYAFAIEMVIYKSFKIKELYSIALRAGTTTAIVFIIVAAAQALSWALAFARIPQSLTEGMLSLEPSRLGLLFMLNLLFFIAHLFVDGLVAKVVLVPVVFPIIQAYGIDPIHFGVLVTLHGAVGSATPPFGCDIFTAAAIFDEPFFKVVRGVPPFVLCGVIVIIIMTLFPQISLLIPNLAFK